MRQSAPKVELGGKTPIQWLVETLEENSYFCRFETDSNNRVMCLLFSHLDCIETWKLNPNILMMDGAYKTNRFGQVCINVCGCSGNNMTPQLAICFLSEEGENDYLWLLGCFIELLEE